MSKKHDANVKKNTLVNFQIGLIASLLFTYLLFEIPTKKSDYQQPNPKKRNIEEPVFQIGEVIEEKPLQIDIPPRRPQNNPRQTGGNEYDGMFE